MKLKAVSEIMLILLFIGIFTLAFKIQPIRTDPTTIYVDDDNTGGPWDGTPQHPYQNITSALQHVSDNDTIYVFNGIYYENIVINMNNLTLIGENKDNTIINGSGLEYSGDLVIIRADNVDLGGFTVTNAGLQGIRVENRRYCKVHDNIVCFTLDRGIVFESGGNNSAYNNVVYNSSAYGGIDAVHSSNNTIYNNIAYFNPWGISTNHGSHNLIYNNTVYSNEGAGIHIDWPSTGNIIYNNNFSLNTYVGIMVMNEANGTVISGNKISGSEMGIWLENSLGNSIIGNNITTNSNNGIGLCGSSNNTIIGNNITNNDCGIRLTASSRYNTIQGNNITDNVTGIHLNESPENNVLGNDITGNSFIGILLAYSSNYNRISGNNITDNNHGAALFESSNNSFYYNNFVNNTHQVSTGEILHSPNIWDNGYPSGGNYWSNYAGVDADGDGIGDTPYVIDPNNQDNYPLHMHVLRVPEDYLTVAEAIEAATPRATITIAPGIYHESLVINKTLRVIGKTGSPGPEFDGGGSGIAITLLPGASGSVVSYFVITNYDQGIFAENSDDCKIYNNGFEGNTIAINLTESSANNVIYVNTMSENEVGIDLSNSNDNTIYHNNFVNNLENARSEESSNVWDNGYPSGGNYWSDYTGIDANLDGIGDTAYVIDTNNTDNYPLMNLWIPPDIAVMNVTPSKTVVGQGYAQHITVTVTNQGNKIEMLNANVYGNTTFMASQSIILTSGNSTVITLVWNTTGFAKGNYTVNVAVTPVQGETDTSDNTLVDGWVFVTIVGDVDGDRDVDVGDQRKVQLAMFSSPGDPKWNPNMDIDSDLDVDVGDQRKQQLRMFESW